MTTSLVLTVLGDDRPGLVESVSEIVVAHGGEWVGSRMASLVGKFAGLLHVNIPDDKVEAFTAAVQSGQLSNLQVLVEAASSQNAEAESSRGLVLELVGQDRPGIVHQISQAISKLNINVDELETSVFEASMSGELMFQAKVHLGVPEATDVGQLRDVLEDLGNELMVDIQLDDEA